MVNSVFHITFSNVIASVNNNDNQGVIVGSRLKFELHISNALAQAFVRSNHIRNNIFLLRDLRALICALKKLKLHTFYDSLLGHVHHVIEKLLNKSSHLRGYANISQGNKGPQNHVRPVLKYDVNGVI